MSKEVTPFMGNQNSLVTRCETFARGYLSSLVYDLYEALDSLQRALFPPGYAFGPYPGSPLTPSQVSKEIAYDVGYIRSRIASEGIGFVMHALPRLDAYALALLAGRSVALPEGFAPYQSAVVGFARDGVIRFECPRLMRSGWIMLRFLEAHSAFRNDHSIPPDESLVDCLGKFLRIFRSIFLACYKMELPCSDDLSRKAFRKFVDTETELRSFRFSPDNSVLEAAEHVCDHVLEGFLPPVGTIQFSSKTPDEVRSFSRPHFPSGLVSDWVPLTWTPRHGPGAVATGERLDDKWRFSHKYVTVDSTFPYVEFMYGITSNGRRLHLAARAREYRSLELMEYPVAKLVEVPKDSRGPRLISEEPLEVQYLQQMLARPLMRHLEKVSAAAGQINFADQQVNANLALEASRFGEWATMDLKDASDRVTTRLVLRLLPRRLHRLFLALRSYATRLPDGTEVWLEKFAPMGSALCFPVESLIFYAICVGTLIVRCGLPMDVALGLVFVYGDDIIVPSEHTPVIADELQEVGLEVNTAKTFATGLFRESCGMDAFWGARATPLRLKKVPGIDRRDGTWASSYVKYADTLWGLGARHALRYVEKWIEQALGALPKTSSQVGYLSYVRPGEEWEVKHYPGLRWDEGLQQFTSPQFVIKVANVRAWAAEWEHLCKAILSPSADSDPSRLTDRNSVSLRRRRVIVM